MKSLLDQPAIIEYPDAPSGSVIFYNYKEPLMRFTEGYGYQGALIFDAVNEKIQCHFCGEWFEQLGSHLHREHNMSASLYKSKVGLRQTTALVNERTRAKLIARGLDARKKNLRPGKKHTKATKEKIRNTLLDLRAESQNENGTCPEQLLDRLRKMHDRLGYTPSSKIVTFYETLVKVHGSYQEACRRAGIPYRKVGETSGRHHKYTKETMTAYFHSFFSEHQRFPRYKEMNKSLATTLSIRFNRKEIEKAALLLGGAYTKSPTRVRYTKDELLEFLRSFEKHHGRQPSYSDAKRGLLPSLSRYSYNFGFGSWKDALKLAHAK